MWVRILFASIPVLLALDIYLILHHHSSAREAKPLAELIEIPIDPFAKRPAELLKARWISCLIREKSGDFMSVSCQGVPTLNATTYAFMDGQIAGLSKHASPVGLRIRCWFAFSPERKSFIPENCSVQKGYAS